MDRGARSSFGVLVEESTSREAASVEEDQSRSHMGLVVELAPHSVPDGMLLVDMAAGQTAELCTRGVLQPIERSFSEDYIVHIAWPS